MGTFNTSIEGNDVFQDIYSAFMDRYHSGDDPRQITQEILSSYSDYFNDADDKSNALFGLSKAQWETMALDEEIFKKVKDIIISGKDLENWRASGATNDLIKKRKDRLDKFLKTLSAVREKPKRRVHKKLDFETKEIVRLISPDNKKVLEIKEEFGDKKYIHTSGLLLWASGGCSILYYNQPDQNISAQWTDDQTLEIVHDKSIVFSKKAESAFFMGDPVTIKYSQT